MGHLNNILSIKYDNFGFDDEDDFYLESRNWLRYQETSFNV